MQPTQHHVLPAELPSTPAADTVIVPKLDATVPSALEPATALPVAAAPAQASPQAGTCEIYLKAYDQCGGIGNCVGAKCVDGVSMLPHHAKEDGCMLLLHDEIHTRISC